MTIEVDTEEWCSPKCSKFSLEEEHCYAGSFDDFDAVYTLRSCKNAPICRNAVYMYRKWSEVQNSVQSDIS